MKTVIMRFFARNVTIPCIFIYIWVEKHTVVCYYIKINCIKIYSQKMAQVKKQTSATGVKVWKKEDNLPANLASLWLQ